MDTKTCSKCRDTKHLDSFYKDARNTGPKGMGVASICKECSTAKKREWYRNNEARYKVYNQAYYSANARRQTIQKFVYKTKIPFTLEEYDALLAAQNGVCKICGKPQNGKSLAIDHCHTTGKVRGLLCENCNNGLGRFKDDPALLRSAILYLGELP